MGTNTPPAIRDSEEDLLKWLDSAILAGRSIMKREPTYAGISEAIAFLNGNQTGIKPQQLSKVTLNRLRKCTYEVVSAMSDVRPVWSYQTNNNEYKEQADILNTIVRNWWRNQYCDRRLQDSLMYSCVGGTGYLKVEWNPNLPGGGDIELIPLDTRDVIPINPTYNPSLQNWDGVAIRRVVSTVQLRQRYPDKFYRYRNSTKVWFDSKRARGSMGSAEMRTTDVISPVLDRLFSNKDPVDSSAEVDLISIWVKDNSLNTGPDKILMGRPGTNWCYWVYPIGAINPLTQKVTTEEEAKLYPRGRLIICTTDTILEDIPNPYWHGNWPLVKFTLDPQPWSILGSSMVQDSISMQESLNECLRGIEDAVKQWLRRTVVGDRNAVSRSLINKLDSRIAGQKVLLNPTAGEGFKYLDGPQLPPYVMEYVQMMLNTIDDNFGVKGLQELAKLRQMPSADVIEKFQNAQTQLLRLRSAQVESGLAELADLVKCMIFQFYDAPRRVQILGSDGLTMQDFDYDPRVMVPALLPTDQNYRPEYDVNLTTQHERAQRHHRNFAFSVTRNSMLNTSHTQAKMFLLQLARMPGGPLIDPWTLLEAFDVPNLGPVPKGSVFDRVHMAQTMGIYPPSPMMVAQMQQAQQQGQAGPPNSPPQGGGGPVKTNEVPRGHPPSGQQAPTPVVRTDQQTGGTRQVVSESSRT